MAADVMSDELPLGTLFAPRSGGAVIVDAQRPIMKGGMGGHERVSDGKDEWLTPKEITDSLGPFDLDPCSPVKRP